MAVVRVKRGRAKPLWHGHPWLWSQGIDRIDGKVEPGDVVDVADDQGRFIGRGFYNPASQIAVRLCTRKEEPVDGSFLEARLEAAKALRQRLGLPSQETSGFRLINSEGDFLPGLVIDLYGDVAAVQITALGMKKLETQIYDALEKVIAPRSIYAVGVSGVASKEGFNTTPGLARGEENELVAFKEHGLELTIDPLAGQKTGAFLDQRDNRARVAKLARDAEMLDCYTYLGGFALHALKNGAKHATAVDISPRALERAKDHAHRAGVADRLDLVESDVFRYLESVEPRRFDLIVLDPPKFAPSRKDLEAALKGYKKLNTLGMKAAKEGAILASASCSQIVDTATFERMLAAAAVEAGRRLTVLEIHHQPADHPVPPGFTEGRYLKLILARVE